VTPKVSSFERPLEMTCDWVSKAKNKQAGMQWQHFKQFITVSDGQLKVEVLTP